MDITDTIRRAPRSPAPRRRALAPASLLTVIGLGTVCAQAAEPAGLRGYSLSVAAQFDDADSWTEDAVLALPLGAHGWTELRYSRLRSEVAATDETPPAPETETDPDTAPQQTAIDARGFGVQAGFSLGNVELSAAYARRKDGELIKQDDLSAQLSYRWPRAQLGLDLFQRSARSQTLTRVDRPRGDPLPLQIVEDFDGSGIGLHGSVDLNARLRVFAAGMHYDYDSSSNLPRLLARTGLSAVTRDQAFLEDSFSAGLRYQRGILSLTTDYSRDRVLETAEQLQTFGGRLDLALGAHWLVSAWGGYTDSDQWPGVGFAGAQLCLRW